MPIIYYIIYAFYCAVALVLWSEFFPPRLSRGLIFSILCIYKHHFHSLLLSYIISSGNETFKNHCDYMKYRLFPLFMKDNS